MKHLLLTIGFFVFTQTFQAQNYRFLVGTYTNTGKSQGIYSYVMDQKTMNIEQKSVTTGVPNPSYLCVTTDKKFVYSVSESNQGSAAHSYAFDAVTGTLTLINKSLTKSSGPCYITTTPKHVFTANYNGGSLSVFGRNADGSLTDLKQKIQHEGSSVNLSRQKEPHVHQVVVSNNYVLANDLGTDKVTVYAYDSKAESNILTQWDALTVKLGSGPRHLTFNRNGKLAYLVQELDGTVSVLKFSKGKLELLQELSLLTNSEQKGWAADIHLSPDGKFLYATNRAPANNITCFSVDKKGRLELKSQVSTLGDGPRNFAISPDGKFVLVAHQFSNTIVVFNRNAKTGALSDSGKRIDVGAPVCIVFY